METTLLKKIAILAVATCCLVGIDILADTTSTPGRKSKPAVHSSSLHASTGKKSVRTAVRHTRGGRRARRGSPWRISSFGEPAASDNPAGEDPAIRQAAIEALGNWNGSIVVVDPNTGRVLSVVNQKLALQGAFTPCSTFKPVVALGALKEGLITPQTKLRVGRRTRMKLADALARSNNPFFLKLGQMLGFERVAEYAHEFGFGEKAGLNIPGESPGKFPPAPPKEGGVGHLAYTGQDMEVTPLQMAAVISAIANGGTLYYLQYPRTAEETAQFEPRVRRRLEGLAKYFPHIREGMAAAVIYGTGRLAYSPDEQIFGKTGTCSEDGARLGWFVSYANEQQPKYVVVVLLRGGRLMFGPHAAEIAGHLYRDLRHKDQNPTQATRISAFASRVQR